MQLDQVTPTLSFSNLRKDDEGTYACVASNTAGETEDRLQVIVEARPPKPMINWNSPIINDRYLTTSYYAPTTIPPLYKPRRTSGLPSLVIPIEAVEHEVTTREGMNVDLTCMNVGSITPGTSVIWSRSDGVPISSSHETVRGVLHIRRASKSDEATYICKLISSGAVLFQLYANLVVQGNVYCFFSIGNQVSDRHQYADSSDWNPPKVQPPPRYPATTSGCPPGSWRCRVGIGLFSKYKNSKDAKISLNKIMKEI